MLSPLMAAAQRVRLAEKWCNHDGIPRDGRNQPKQNAERCTQVT